MSISNIPQKVPLKTICYEFIKIGSIGFGGGLAIIGIIHDSFVERKKIISEEEFLSGTAISQFIGAFAVNTAYFVGRKARSITGGILAVISFLSPSLITVILLSVAYTHYKRDFQAKYILESIIPVIISILLITSYKFLRNYKNKLLTSIPTAILLIPIVILTDSYITSIFAGGITYSFLNSTITKYKLSDTSSKGLRISTSPLLTFLLPFCSERLHSWLTTPSILKLSFLSLGIGTIFFGGGYALIPLLQQIMVEKLHWISNEDFFLGMAISQITPGPLAIIITFLGFHLFGIPGALISTVLIFTPSIIIMELLIKFYEKAQKQYWLRNFIEGVSLTVGFLILHLCAELSNEFLMPLSVFKVTSFILSLTLLLLRIPPFFVILGSLLLGIFTNYF